MKLYTVAFFVAAGCLMGQMPGRIALCPSVNLMKLTGMFQCPGTKFHLQKSFNTAAS